MALTDEQIKDLFPEVRKPWLEAHGAICGYARGITKNRRVSDLLARGTIAAAIITGLIPIIAAVTQSSSTLASAILTAIAGGLTALLATIDRVVAPNAKVEEFKDQQTKLEMVKLELSSAWLKLPDAQSMDDGLDIVKRVYQGLIEAKKKLDSDLTDEDRKAAETEFKATIIYVSYTKQRVEPEAPLIVAEGGVGIIPARRRKAA